MEPSAPIIQIHTPILAGGFLLQEAALPQNYTHTTEADGGYGSASWSQALTREEIGDWLNHGAMRHVIVSSGLEIVWEGFVNQFDIAYGNLTATVGPVLDTANRANLVYSKIVATDPPTIGIKTETGVANNALSQAWFGIRSRVLSTGGCTDAIATQIRDMYLAQNAWPRRTMNWGGQGGQGKLTLSCLGYRHLLDYPYNDATATIVDTDVKIRAVLAADPNSLFDDYHVEAPAAPTTILRFEDEDNPAWDVISEAVSYGDASLNRWTFGVYGGRECWYQQVVDIISYQIYLTDPGLRITDSHGTEVKPWFVRPGRWVLFADLLPGYTEPATLQEDPRAMFIESVMYTAPNGLQLSGARTDKLTTLLAQYGLSGL